MVINVVEEPCHTVKVEKIGINMHMHGHSIVQWPKVDQVFSTSKWRVFESTLYNKLIIMSSHYLTKEYENVCTLWHIHHMNNKNGINENSSHYRPTI